ncbi:hypothetical protein HKX48_009369, partial [Thoreauomyces humboldtii]
MSTAPKPPPAKKRRTTATPAKTAKVARGSISNAPGTPNAGPAAVAGGPSGVSAPETTVLPPAGTVGPDGEPVAVDAKDKEKEDDSDGEDELDDYALPQGFANKDAEKALFDTFTAAQQARYETFRRSKIQKGAMKK